LYENNILVKVYKIFFPELYQAKMTHDEDVERASQKNDERTPLLKTIPPHAIEEDQEVAAPEDRQSPRDEHEEAALLEPPPQRRSKWWYAWRIFWVILGALVLALFIKGWIDADDTNVRRRFPGLPRFCVYL
jgi:hypothetical protein